MISYYRYILYRKRFRMVYYGYSSANLRNWALFYTTSPMSVYSPYGLTNVFVFVAIAAQDIFKADCLMAKNIPKCRKIIIKIRSCGSAKGKFEKPLKQYAQAKTMLILDIKRKRSCEDLTWLITLGWA